MTKAAVDRIAASLRTATLEQVSRMLPTDDYGHGSDLAPATCSDCMRVGMDLVPVDDVAASVERLGRRYLYRVFTPHERACARIGHMGSHPAAESARADTGRVDRASTRYSMQSLAGRFAAKEAAVKVLRPRGTRPEWRSIEVHRTVGGWCELRLSGLAALLATDAGITALAVSVTHEPMMAAACVVAMSEGGATAWHRMSPLKGEERSHG
jgi:holo-[acyl-carrier protein] synthase